MNKQFLMKNISGNVCFNCVNIDYTMYKQRMMHKQVLCVSFKVKIRFISYFNLY